MGIYASRLAHKHKILEEVDIITLVDSVALYRLTASVAILMYGAITHFLML